MAPSVNNRYALKVAALPKGSHAYTECFYQALEAAGIKVVEADFSGTWLLQQLRRGDWLHVHWPSFLYQRRDSMAGTDALRFAKAFGLLAVLATRGVRIAWTVHNLYPHEGGATRMHRVGRTLMARLSSLVCVHGAAAARRVEQEFGVPASRIVEITHGHWVDYFRPGPGRELARRELGIPADAIVFGMVGAIEPYKHPELLIEAFGRMRSERPCHLLLAGRFRSSAYRERLRRSCPDPRLVSLEDGYIPDDRLGLYLDALDCMVLPYRDILTSGGAMLALSYDRPVIAPAIGSLVEVVTDAVGRLYPESGTAEDLATAMEQVTGQPPAPGACRKWALQFDWDSGAVKLATRMVAWPESR